MVDSRSNSLLVRAPNPSRLQSIRSLVAKLDQPSAGAHAGGNIWVVPLKNADATKLATVLRSAFASGPGGASSSGSTQTATIAAAPAPAGGGASLQATSPVSPSAGPSTGGFIQADPSTNSLIITAASRCTGRCAQWSKSSTRAAPRSISKA